MNLIGTIKIILLVIGVAEAAVEYTPLDDNGIYSFENQFDGLYLTAVSLSTPYAPIVTDMWMDAPTQKWRAKSALMSKSYQLFPIYADEGQVMYYDVSQGIVYQDSPGIGLTNKQYWQLQDVGQGYYLIRSYVDGRCLENMGPGQPVAVVTCTYIPAQQWAINVL